MKGIRCLSDLECSTRKLLRHLPQLGLSVSASQRAGQRPPAFRWLRAVSTSLQRLPIRACGTFCRAGSSLADFKFTPWRQGRLRIRVAIRARAATPRRPARRCGGLTSASPLARSRRPSTTSASGWLRRLRFGGRCQVEDPSPALGGRESALGRSSRLRASPGRLRSSCRGDGRALTELRHPIITSLDVAVPTPHHQDRLTARALQIDHDVLSAEDARRDASCHSNAFSLIRPLGYIARAYRLCRSLHRY